MTDTRKQVEREIAEWLRDHVVVPSQIDRPLILAFLWAITHPFTFGKQFGRIEFAAQAAQAIERGEYRKDEA